MTASSWKEKLQGIMPEKLADEIDVYEGQLHLRKQGKIHEKVFAETRLRRGSYGQRYDNGHRHDGLKERTIDLGSDLTKGPETLWGAPGMQRIKIPFGGLTADQMDVLADIAEEYSDGILHITTRQDFQVHYVHIEDCPNLMRRLASVNITTREACGNSVRNVTACPIAGVCRDQTFDVTPYSKALAYFLLGHPDCQDFGRKFKIAFSGCGHNACGLTSLHDLGFLAKVRDGKRGFEVVVGGGLGSVPQQAKLLAEFCPEEEIMPLSQAVARVFARHGEKANRNKARVKFLITKLGIEEFTRLVHEERKVLPHDPHWTGYLQEVRDYEEKPLKDAVSLTISGKQLPEGYDAWSKSNIYKQRQAGYATVTVALPLGDLTSTQMRKLADIARKYCGDNVRTTVEQNMVLRWISEDDVPKVYAELKAIGLGLPGAGTIEDVVSCPGTDTCKLGIASSRGLAGELRHHLARKNGSLDLAVKNLHVKISGCFNSCGQHHIADIGFYGNSRKVGNYTVPHFQVVLGGEWTNNAGTYGLAMGSVPSKAVPQVLDTITDRYVKDRQGDESFQAWVKRLGKKEMRTIIEPFMKVPDYTEDPSYYTDWGDPREFTIGDMGMGECAGEIVSLFSMEIIKAESEVFEAQIALDDGNYKRADALAYRSMVMAARALVRNVNRDVAEDYDSIVREFTTRFYDTQLFYDRFVGGKFAQYLFARHENPEPKLDHDSVHQLVEEAQVFIESVHNCEQRMSGVSLGGVKI